MPRKQARDRIYAKACASARFCGTHLDPSEVTRLLQLPPDISHRAGDLNLSRSAKGKVQVFSPFSMGVWAMSSEDWVDSPKLQVHLEWLLSELEPKADSVARILNEGVEADFYCISRGATDQPPTISSEVFTRSTELGFRIEIAHEHSSEE